MTKLKAPEGQRRYFQWWKYALSKNLWKLWPWWNKEFSLLGIVGDYTVTFQEDNGVDEAVIQLYSDGSYEEAISAPVTTKDGGEATMNLHDGTYYYKVTHANHEDYENDFEVNGADLAVNFELVPNWAVTFNEQNDEAGVAIQVYADDGRTQLVTQGTTVPPYGYYVPRLPDGDYWFTATKDGFQTLEDDFTVNGANLIVEITMVADEGGE